MEGYHRRHHRVLSNTLAAASSAENFERRPSAYGQVDQQPAIIGN